MPSKSRAFALAEFDDGFSNRTILIADRRDGEPWPDKDGPWRFVVPNDKRLARWVRGVTSIEVISVAD